MKVELNNKFNNIDEIIKFVENVNKGLIERNYPRFKITVEVKVKTHPNDRISKQIKFALLEDDRYCDWVRVASGITWESFVDDIGDELGDSFLRMTGLQKVTNDLDLPVNYIQQEIKSNEENDPDNDDDESDNENDIDIEDIDLIDLDDEEDEEEGLDEDPDNDDNDNGIETKLIELKHLRDSTNKKIKEMRARQIAQLKVKK